MKSRVIKFMAAILLSLVSAGCPDADCFRHDHVLKTALECGATIENYLGIVETGQTLCIYFEPAPGSGFVSRVCEKGTCEHEIERALGIKEINNAMVCRAAPKSRLSVCVVGLETIMHYLLFSGPARPGDLVLIERADGKRFYGIVHLTEPKVRVFRCDSNSEVVECKNNENNLVELNPGEILRVLRLSNVPYVAVEDRGAVNYQP